MKERPRLAVFGGSFNPPHLGHALMPSYLLARDEADQVLVAPCYAHALGKELTPFEDRVAMVELALSHYRAEQVWVSRIERDLALEGGGEPKPSYTLHLLEALAQRYPKHEIRLVVGSDITETGETEKWHRWDRIAEEFDPIVVPRAGFCPEGHATLPEIQSRDVRKRLAMQAEARPAGDQAWLERSLPAAVLRRLDEQAQGCLWVVGSGHAATHLAARLRRMSPHFVVHQLSARGLLEDPVETTSGAPRPDGIWILAKDHATADLASALSGLGLDPATPLLHGAGSLRSEDALTAWPGPKGTLHPICSLRRERPRSHIDHAGWGVEGDAVAREFALRIVGEAAWLDLQGLDGSQRSAYHAACALVANHVAVLVAEGRAILSGLVRSEAEALWRVLDGLIHSAVGNLMALGIPAGVTGPVARGEMEVAAKHAAALGGQSGELYRTLSQRLAERLAE
jgi:nicotinate (nicotinamide) nucleotide adenylyltransferase